MHRGLLHSLGVAALLAGCGSGGDTTSADFGVSFPEPAAANEAATSSLHFWVLDGTDVDGFNCSNLVGGEAYPYHPRATRFADVVVVMSDAQRAMVDKVPAEEVMVYVQANDFRGDPKLAGCLTVDLGRETSVTIPLSTAGAFDCADPNTADGLPCDDGLWCTVSENCRGGTCQGGLQRDCSALVGECLVGVCNETDGCVAALAADNTPCDDSTFCTTGEVCTAGVCGGGVTTDCSTYDGAECRVGECYLPGDYCQSVDVNLECAYDLHPDCNTAAPYCSIDNCYAGTPEAEADVPCAVECYDGALCAAGTGVCFGGTLKDPGEFGTETPGDGNCDDLRDNDCDGLIDTDDPDCTL